MGVFAGDVDDLFPGRLSGATSSDEPLGTRLRGRASDENADAVEAVRELRDAR